MAGWRLRLRTVDTCSCGFSSLSAGIASLIKALRATQRQQRYDQTSSRASFTPGEREAQRLDSDSSSPHATRTTAIVTELDNQSLQHVCSVLRHDPKLSKLMRAVLDGLLPVACMMLQSQHPTLPGKRQPILAPGPSCFALL